MLNTDEMMKVRLGAMFNVDEMMKVRVRSHV